MKTISRVMPSTKTKNYKLLQYLLKGVHVDPMIAFAKMNLTTTHARVSELRKLGWPIQTVMMPHSELEGEQYPVYMFDSHFLRWCGERELGGKQVDPREYKHNQGRGRFKVERFTVIEGGNRERA